MCEANLSEPQKKEKELIELEERQQDHPERQHRWLVVFLWSQLCTTEWGEYLLLLFHTFGYFKFSFHAASFKILFINIIDVQRGNYSKMQSINYSLFLYILGWKRNRGGMNTYLIRGRKKRALYPLVCDLTNEQPSSYTKQLFSLCTVKAQLFCAIT